MNIPAPNLPSVNAMSAAPAGAPPLVRQPLSPATATAVAVAAEGSKDASIELRSELAAANNRLAESGHELRFEYDRDVNRLIVRLVDISTLEVIRQFPSEEALHAARLVKSGKPIISMRA